MNPRFLASASLLFAMVLPGLDPATAREFTDRDGRKMEADLVSHAGAASPTVKIRKDGREFTVEIARFSGQDQEFIREWMKATPPADALAVKATRKNVGGGKFLYEIELRNLGEDALGKMSAEYIVYMENSAGTVVSDRGKTDFTPAIPPKGAVELATAPLDPNTIIANQGGTTNSITVNSSNDRRKRRSDLLGIIVRIHNENGQRVTEWRSPGSGFPDKWPEEKNTTTGSDGPVAPKTE